MFGGELPNRRGPTRLNHYVDIHQSCIASLLAKGFVVRDDCILTPAPGVLLIEGTIHCLDGIEMEVTKAVAVVSGTGQTAMVKTASRTYNAWIRGHRQIFRYDSPHPGHNTFHHKHEFDTFGNGQETVLIPISNEDDIPTLTEAIKELETWHAQNAVRLRALP